jgi:transposase
LILAPYLARAEELGGQQRDIEKALVETVIKLPETRYLVSVKGVGLITTAMILGETGSLTLYHHAGELIKVAGLNLFRLSSGTHAGSVKITKRGRPLLRCLLYFAALRQTRPGMPLYYFYQRLITGGVWRMKALIAVARRLLRVLFAVVRDQREYTSEWSAQLAA